MRCDLRCPYTPVRPDASAGEHTIREAEAHSRAAEAESKSIAAELTAAERDLQRFEALLQADAGSRKQRDDAQARVDVARERHRSAQERARAAREVVALHRAGARREGLDVARAGVIAVDAQIAALQEAVADARITSPTSGVVIQKLVDAGELVDRGTPVAVVMDIDHAWVNLFLPEPAMSRLKVGQPATVLTAETKRLLGHVTFVSQDPEFTPRNVQSAQGRSKLVYRIKVSVDNREGMLKPGMPVHATIVLQ